MYDGSAEISQGITTVHGSAEPLSGSPGRTPRGGIAAVAATAFPISHTVRALESSSLQRGPSDLRFLGAKSAIVTAANRVPATHLCSLLLSRDCVARPHAIKAYRRRIGVIAY